MKAHTTAVTFPLPWGLVARRALSTAILASLLALVALGTLGMPSPAMAEATLPSGVYIIQMSDSDMTVAATSDRRGSPMMLWPYRPSATWAFKHLGGNIYTVRTNASMLDGTHAKPGSPATITASKSKEGQRWALKRVGQFYQLINVETGLALELSRGQRIKGNTLQADTPSDSRDQLFCIQRPRDPKYCGSGKKDSRQQRTPQRNDIFDTETNFAR